MTKRIIFLGATGKADRHALPHHLAPGCRILNPDVKPFDHPGVNALITDAGQVFNAVNDRITANLPTAEVLKRHAPNTPITRKMRPNEAPLSNRKMRDVPGFREAQPWRNHVMT